MTDQEIEATLENEEVEGVVQCFNCDYWGKMQGVIRWDDKKWIYFICPECNAAEQVRNSEFNG